MPNKHKRAPLSLRLPGDLIARVEAAASASGRPVRALIAEAVAAAYPATPESPPAAPRLTAVPDTGLAAAVAAANECLCGHAQGQHFNGRGGCLVCSALDGVPGVERCSRWRRPR